MKYQILNIYIIYQACGVNIETKMIMEKANIEIREGDWWKRNISYKSVNST